MNSMEQMYRRETQPPKVETTDVPKPPDQLKPPENTEVTDHNRQEIEQMKAQVANARPSA